MVPKEASGRPEKLGYRKLTLFFMSGTGNSYRNTRWIESEAAKHGLEAGLNLVPATHPASISVERETLFGFVMSTHGFTAPWPMIRFVLRLPRGEERTPLRSSAAAVPRSAIDTSPAWKERLVT